MENIQSNIWGKMTIYKDNLSDYRNRELSLGIRYKANETCLNELVHIWSLKINLQRNIKNQIWKI